MSVFKDLEMVEHLGSGLPRITEFYGPESFHFTENFLRITFAASRPVHEEAANDQGEASVTDPVLRLAAKAKTACEVSGHAVVNHFPDVRKMVRIGSGTERNIDDLMLTRYARTHGLTSEPQISHEHVTNNQAVRDILLSRGIRPESLPPEEDVKKVERRLSTDAKKALKNPDTLDGERKTPLI